jgi:hypothetical protein
MLRRFPTEESYARIGDALAPINVTAEDLSVERLTPKDIMRAGAILDWHGAVLLRDFVDGARIDAARHEADAIVARLHDGLAAGGNQGEADGIPWQIGGARFRDHKEILAQGRPLANLRSRDRGTMNGGVIDLFFVDQLARERGLRPLAECCECLTTGAAAQIVASVSPTRPAQVNLLRNDSIPVTRGLHFDNLRGSYKIFLYLDDVRSPDDGPYAYVPGSHRRPDLLRREARLNALCGTPESDSHAFEGREIAFLAGKGSAIVSCQSGVHRGLPQRPGASRTVLVASYRN